MLAMISIRSWDMLGGVMEAAHEICTVIGAKNAKSRSWWRPFQVECFQNRHLTPDHFVSGHLSSVDVHSDQVFMELFDSWGMDELLSRYRRAYANCFQDTAAQGIRLGKYCQPSSPQMVASTGNPPTGTNWIQVQINCSELWWCFNMFDQRCFLIATSQKGPGLQEP